MPIWRCYECGEAVLNVPHGGHYATFCCALSCLTKFYQREHLRVVIKRLLGGASNVETSHICSYDSILTIFHEFLTATRSVITTHGLMCAGPLGSKMRIVDSGNWWC